MLNGSKIHFSLDPLTKMQDKRRQLPGTRTREIPPNKGSNCIRGSKTMQLQAFLFKLKTKQSGTKTVLSFFIALCQAIWKRKPLSLCTYSRNVKSKDKKRKKNAEKDGRWGECFIFLQQNSLIFFYVETAETATETEIRERCKKGRKNAKSEKAKIQWVCVCGWIWVCECVVWWKRKRWLHWHKISENRGSSGNNNWRCKNGKRETQTNVTQQFLWVWQKWIIRMDPGHRRLFF